MSCHRMVDRHRRQMISSNIVSNANDGQNDGHNVAVEVDCLEDWPPEAVLDQQHGNETVAQQIKHIYFKYPINNEIDRFVVENLLHFRRLFGNMFDHFCDSSLGQHYEEFHKEGHEITGVYSVPNRQEEKSERLTHVLVAQELQSLVDVFGCECVCRQIEWLNYSAESLCRLELYDINVSARVIRLAVVGNSRGHTRALRYEPRGQVFGHCYLGHQCNRCHSPPEVCAEVVFA